MLSWYCGVAHLHFSLEVDEFLSLEANTDFRKHSSEELAWWFNDYQTVCLHRCQVYLRYSASASSKSL